MGKVITAGVPVRVQLLVPRNSFLIQIDYFFLGRGSYSSTIEYCAPNYVKVWPAEMDYTNFTVFILFELFSAYGVWNFVQNQGILLAIVVY
jgi:hypothetical protein